MLFFCAALLAIPLSTISAISFTTLENQDDLYDPYDPYDPSLPSWWNQWRQSSFFSSPFIQEGESAAFGKLIRKGSILTARGGRLRVEYEKGILLLCNGKQLIQYDQSTRTAQMHDLNSISAEWPLLRILTDPGALAQVFNVNALDSGAIKLSSKKNELPEILLEGKGSFLHKVSWVDGTGARQTLTLTAPRIPKDPGNSPFTFLPPSDTKWIQ
ncbi:MAG: outer membrane lipoprotein carrier protein LolA [Holophagaceae bacterium]|nr:outer membrane lipoprotein carrier protein LolA [Holophagaceae bacterium]